MGHWIEYQAVCFTIPAGLRGAERSRFVIALEGGPNNLTERTRSGRERRVRDWYIGMIGTEVQVLRQAVRVAGDCEGMSLRLSGREATPEAYIRRIRRLLAKPERDVTQHITLRATVPRHHPLVSRAKHFGLAEQQFVGYGEEQSHLHPPCDASGADWGAFLRAVDPFIEDSSVVPNRLGQVWHLPSS
jgi:hypothetical protein